MSQQLLSVIWYSDNCYLVRSTRLPRPIWKKTLHAVLTVNIEGLFELSRLLLCELTHAYVAETGDHREFFDLLERDGRQ